MIGVVDYGAGNLQSVANALGRIGLPYRVCETADSLAEVDRIVLPGVGHFGAAARAMTGSGIGAVLRAAAGDGKPLLGICLGMQLLLETSEEAPGIPGLGLLPGTNVRLRTARVPHMGWNRVTWKGRDDHFYFAHGFAAETRPENVLATADMDGVAIPAVIGTGMILGVQFHPEKSGERGLALLEDFCRC